MKNQELKVKNRTVDIQGIKSALDKCSEVASAYLFGSAAGGQKVVNDLDILILLHPNIDKNEAFIRLTLKLTEALKIPEACIDILFFDLEEADLSVLSRAVNRGILLINRNQEYLSNMIDRVSRCLLENEPMMIRARRLRHERMEVFGEA